MRRLGVCFFSTLFLSALLASSPVQASTWLSTVCNLVLGGSWRARSELSLAASRSELPSVRKVRVFGMNQAATLAHIQEELSKLGPYKAPPPDAIPFPDDHYRETAKQYAGMGLEKGSVFTSRAEFLRTMDGRWRSFLIIATEKLIRAAADNAPSSHAGMAQYQDIETAGEFRAGWGNQESRPDPSLIFSAIPKSGAYFKNAEFNTYLTLAKGLAALWRIGVFPDEFVILDVDTRAPLIEFDLKEAQPRS